MIVLLLGLILFLGVHSLRIVADDWRSAQVARLGERKWKRVFSLVSIAGFVLIIWGYGLARAQPVVLWAPPPWTRPVAAVLTLLSFVLLAAANVPRNGLKAKLHHPMVLGVVAWAFGHLLANGTLADGLLFGGFLVWGGLSFRAARRRDRGAGVTYPEGTTRGSAIAVAAGVLLWVLFAFWAHAWLFGVAPLG